MNNIHSRLPNNFIKSNQINIKALTQSNCLRYAIFPNIQTIQETFTLLLYHRHQSLGNLVIIVFMPKISNHGNYCAQKVEHLFS